MAKITECLVQGSDAEADILSTRLTDVNMRLFRGNPFYRQIVMDIVSYMEGHLTTYFEDYTNVRGVCAGSLGINCNIIGYKCNGKNKFCINPKIVGRSEAGVISETKCGSFQMAAPVKVFRHEYIDLEYYDLRGHHHREKNIGRLQGGFTIQHEVDQSLGVTVFDKEIKDGQ